MFNLRYFRMRCKLWVWKQDGTVFTVFTVEVFWTPGLDTFRNSVSQNWLSEDGCLKHRSSPVVSLSLPEKKIIAKSGRVHWLETPHKWQVESFVAKITDTTDHTVVPGTPVFHAVKEAEWKGRPSTSMAKTFKAKLSKTFGSFEQMLGPILGGANPLPYFAGDVFERCYPDLMVNCMEVQ